MRKLAIKYLRGINELDFPVPERAGAYLLTGANGAGKSTVLSCLSRLSDPQALDRFFVPDLRFTDANPEAIYCESHIRFEANGEQCEFQMKNGHWIADHEENVQKTFDAFGFSQVIFADQKKKNFPEPDEVFSVKDIQPVPDILRTTTAEIFDNDIYHQLHRIRSKITGKEFFLIRHFEHGEEYYFSENNFGSGERAVIRLLSRMFDMPPGALILLDEAEMALHPKARKRLWDFLSRTALARSFVILVSTQSASLIRSVDPKQILYLEKEEGGQRFVCRSEVYPAIVLGEMALPEDILPETILLVEDQEAAMLLTAIVEKLKTCIVHDFPYCRILPVGGYMQVVILMDNLSKVFPPYVRKRAVLDRDAEANIHKTLDSPQRPHFDVVARNYKKIFYLPCAPEQGVVRLLEADVSRHSRGISKLFHGCAIHLEDVMFFDERYRNIPGTSRSDCKDKLTLIVHRIMNICGEPESFVRKKLYRYYTDVHYRDIQKLKRDYCPLIFQR